MGDQRDSITITTKQVCPETLAQWHRVHLSFSRLWRDYQLGTPISTDEMELDARNFFMHCHHLADYLLSFDGLDAMPHVKASSALALCRDLVINFKHARMTRGSFVPGGELAGVSGVLSMSVHMSPDGEGPFEVSPTITLEVAGQKGVDALRLAEGCMVAWILYGLPQAGAPLHGSATFGGAKHSSKAITLKNSYGAEDLLRWLAGQT